MTTVLSDEALVAGLRAGEESAFTQLLNAWSTSMLRLARSFVSTDASAEEVVQDTWLAVIQGIDRFEGRSSLRTWVYRILVNTAKKRGVREHRTVPWTSLLDADDQGLTLDPSAFRGAGDEYPGHWATPPSSWPSTEGAVIAAEVRLTIAAALETLPARQRMVITLRDVIGHPADEVCEMLGLSATNQRVLLHRARSAVRVFLGDYLRMAATGEGPSLSRPT